MIDLTNFPRWIVASIMKHVDANRQDVPIFVEGQNRQLNTLKRHFEVRVDGPHSRPTGTRGEYCFWVGINILASSTYDEKDVYHLKKMLGIATQILNSDICVRKWGNDDAFLGILQRLDHDGIEVHEFGEIGGTSTIYQGAAEAQYEMSFP